MDRTIAIGPIAGMRLEMARQELDPLLTHKEVAALMRLSPRHLTRLLREGRLVLPTVRGTTRPRYRRDDVERMLRTRAA